MIADAAPSGALVARWPDPVLSLSADAKQRRVRSSKTPLPEGWGGEVVIVDGDAAEQPTRGFVRASLTVPLHHDKGAVYVVYVEVERAPYLELKRAAAERRPIRVDGKLATRLPYLDAAFGTRVEIAEDGEGKRPRVVAADSPLLVEGPKIGPVGR